MLGEINGLAHHIWAQNHARAAPCGGVIDVLMLAIAKFAQVHGFELPFAILKRFARQALTQNTGKGTGEKRDDLCLPDADQIGRIGHQLARFDRRA